jgi:hypothetical protein
MKRRSFTLYSEVECEVSISDILENLSTFRDVDLKQLQDAINDQLDEVGMSKAKTLEEEQKIKILNEFFDKYTWEELENIKKSLK